MKKIFEYADLVALDKNFTKTNFIYQDSKYSTYYHKNDSSPMIKHLTDGTKAIKYSSFMFKVREDLKIDQPTKEDTQQSPIIPATIAKLIDVDDYLVEDKKELPKAFLELMQLDIFKDDYQAHRNIKFLDFEALNKDHKQSYKLDKVLPILHFSNKNSLNVRYKWNGNKKLNGWYTLSDINSRGAFIESDIKASTLILCEGLKDGINANIALLKADVLITDSKSTTFDFKMIPNFTLKKYKTILFIQDNNVSEKDMLRMVQGVAGENKALQKSIEKKVGIGAVLDNHKDIIAFYKKTRFYNHVNAEISDLTDIIKSYDLTRAKTKRSSLSMLKKGCSNERFISIYNREEIKLIDSYLDIYMNTSNVEKFMLYTLKKISLGGDVTREFKYYMGGLVKPPKSATILHLDNSKFLSPKTDDIKKLFNKHSHILIGSPTGTGKSSLVRGKVKDSYKHIKGVKTSPESVIDEGLPLEFDNIIFIVPLTALAVEAGQHPLFTHVEFTSNHGELGANLNQKYITVTTDTFERLRTHPMTKDMMQKRIEDTELMVFDEQHYPHNVDGFRGLVMSAYSYLESYKGNVLYLSGTPIFSEAPHAHAVVSKLDRKFISKINFFIDPFRDEEDTLQSMREHLKDGSILFYCKSTKEADRVHNVLLEDNYDVVKIKSDEYLYNGKPVTKEFIASIKGKIAYVATTKITTGANLDKLIAIYQHGTAYDPFTFVQLTARLRGNGNYYLIRVQGERVQSDSIQNKAIFVCNMAKKFNISKMSDIWENKEFKKFLKKSVELSYQNDTLKGFLSVYRDVLTLVQSESLGALSRDRKDFEFAYSPKQNYQDDPILKLQNIDSKQIEKIFNGADSVTYRKFFERKIIDSITQMGNIEILNDVFELSFDYIRKNDLKWNEAEPKKFITPDDEAERVEQKNEKAKKDDEFENAIQAKFGDLYAYDTLKKHINNTALNKLLNDDRLDREKDKNRLMEIKEKAVKAKTGVKPVITALQCYLIPTKLIIKTVFNNIKENGYTTLKEVSETIEQKEYLSTKRQKDIFVNFLKDFFIDNTFDKKELIYEENNKKINGKQFRNSITLPKSTLKELKTIEDTKMREQARNAELERLEKQYISVVELIADPKRHKFYDMNSIEKQADTLSKRIERIKE